MGHTYSSSDLAGSTGGVWALELPGGGVLLEYGTQTAGAPNYVHRFDSVAAAGGAFAPVQSVLIPGTDAHGLTTCEKASGEQLLLVTNRLGGEMHIIDLDTMTTIKSRKLTTPEYPEIATDYAQYFEGKLYVAW